jgi:hypothetical protein
MDGHVGYGFLEAVKAAAILRDCEPRPLDLSLACFATQLCDQLVDLAEPGCAIDATPA